MPHHTMPRVNITTSALSTGHYVEIEVPVTTTQEEEYADTCPICHDFFCPTQECGHTAQHLQCCTQFMCCICLLKVSKRCTCASRCTAIIAFCPFCREISPLSPLDIFLGSKAKACKGCSVTSAQETTLPMEIV